MKYLILYWQGVYTAYSSYGVKLCSSAQWDAVVGAIWLLGYSKGVSPNSREGSDIMELAAQIYGD